MLNLGCGGRIHPEWVNVDVVGGPPGVVVHDLRRGIPFETGSFDVVYHSHLLEHLSAKDARTLLGECRRVLRAGGLLRVAVPDLESIAREYLRALEDARRGAPDARFRVRWMTIELLDQATRTEPGGEAAEVCRTASAPERAFIESRWGREARELFANGSPAAPPSRWRAVLREIRRGGARAFREAAASRLGGPAYRVGAFRQSGEVHQWMYDDVALARALEDAGFERCTRVGPAESRMPGWARFELDADASGAPHKPDSLYMEATRAGG
jgi:predicted SAM-dependent methyltransferase